MIERTIPVMASLDIGETVAFYEQMLGFTTGYRDDSEYLIMNREGWTIHFWKCDDRHIAENTSCYVRVANADELHKEFAGRGLALDPPVSYPWGMKELYVIDPHGNLIKFGEDLPETEGSLRSEVCNEEAR